MSTVNNTSSTAKNTVSAVVFATAAFLGFQNIHQISGQSDKVATKSASNAKKAVDDLKKNADILDKNKKDNNEKKKDNDSSLDSLLAAVTSSATDSKNNIDDIIKQIASGGGSTKSGNLDDITKSAANALNQLADSKVGDDVKFASAATEGNSSANNSGTNTPSALPNASSSANNGGGTVTPIPTPSSSADNSGNVTPTPTPSSSDNNNGGGSDTPSSSATPKPTPSSNTNNGGNNSTPNIVGPTSSSSSDSSSDSSSSDNSSSSSSANATTQYSFKIVDDDTGTQVGGDVAINISNSDLNGQTQLYDKYFKDQIPSGYLISDQTDSPITFDASGNTGTMHVVKAYTQDSDLQNIANIQSYIDRINTYNNNSANTEKINIDFLNDNVKNLIKQIATAYDNKDYNAAKKYATELDDAVKANSTNGKDATIVTVDNSYTVLYTIGQGAVQQVIDNGSSDSSASSSAANSSQIATNDSRASTIQSNYASVVQAKAQDGQTSENSDGQGVATTYEQQTSDQTLIDNISKVASSKGQGSDKQNDALQTLDSYVKANYVGKTSIDIAKVTTRNTVTNKTTVTVYTYDVKTGVIVQSSSKV